MTSMNFRRTLVCAAVATALGVLAEPATAAPYHGAFDPPDFSGEYIINVNPTCLLTSGWHANAGICAATLLSAFSDVVSSAPEGPNYTGRLTYAPPAISSSLQLFGLYVVWRPDRFVRHGAASTSRRVAQHSGQLVSQVHVGANALQLPEHLYHWRALFRHDPQGRLSIRQRAGGDRHGAIHRPGRGHSRARYV